MKRLFVALLVFLASSLSHAETIGATAQTQPLQWGYTAYLNGVPWFYLKANLVAACGRLVQEQNRQFNISTATLVNSFDNYGNGVCVINGTPFGANTQFQVNGASSCGPEGQPPVASNGGVCATTYTCPANGNWTLSGSSCSRPDCTAGQTRGTDGICRISCPSAGTSAMGTAAAWAIGGSSASCMGEVSFGGCKMSCSAGVSFGGKASCTGCTYTGENSDVNPGTPVPKSETTTPTTPDGCVAQGKGYVTNSTGVTTCLSPSDVPTTSPVKSTIKGNSTTSGPNGSSSVSNTDTTTSSAGGTTVQRDSTVTAPDGTKSTTTTTADQKSFCESNPNAAICAGTKPDPKTDCDKFPESMGCKELGSPTDTADAIQSKAIGVSSITTVGFASSATCPQDIALPHGAALSFKWPCDMATSLRPILLALAWLAAGLIVMGAFKNG